MNVMQNILQSGAEPTVKKKNNFGSHAVAAHTE
jgi:hypothetical protein